MRCRDCPYGCEEFEKYKSYIDKEDILLVIAVIGMNKTKKIIRIILRKRG